MFLVVFNGIIIMKFPWEYLWDWKSVRIKKVNLWGILIWEAKVLLLDKVLSRFSKSHKLVISLLH